MPNKKLKALVADALINEFAQCRRGIGDERGTLCDDLDCEFCRTWVEVFSEEEPLERDPVSTDLLGGAIREGTITIGAAIQGAAKKIADAIREHARPKTRAEIWDGYAMAALQGLASNPANSKRIERDAERSIAAAIILLDKRPS